MEDEKENQEIQKAVKDLYDLQADYYICLLYTSPSPRD